MALPTTIARHRNAGPKAISDLANVSRDELGHLEHADLTLAVEYRSERFIGINHGSLFSVLKAVPLNVVPKLFGELGTW